MRLARSAAPPLMASTEKSTIVEVQVEPAVLKRAGRACSLLAEEASHVERRSGLPNLPEERSGPAYDVLAKARCCRLVAVPVGFAGDRFHPVAFGEFRDGKGTPVDALVGREASSPGVLWPAAAATTGGRRSGDRHSISFDDRHQGHPSQGGLVGIATTVDNPGHRYGAELGQLELDRELQRARLGLDGPARIGPDAIPLTAALTPWPQTNPSTDARGER